MMEDVDYTELPEHMRKVARDYIENRYRPGDFLVAVLENDLVEAFGQADAINTTAMQNWARWLFNEAPSAAWGSKEKVDAWTAQGV